MLTKLLPQIDSPHLQPSVHSSSPTIDDLGDVDGGVVGHVRVVSSSGDREAEARVASLKRDVVIFPRLLVNSKVVQQQYEEKQISPGWLQQKQNVAAESSVVLGCSALLALPHFEVRDHGSGWPQQLRCDSVNFRKI